MRQLTPNSFYKGLYYSVIFYCLFGLPNYLFSQKGSSQLDSLNFIPINILNEIFTKHEEKIGDFCKWYVDSSACLTINQLPLDKFKPYDSTKVVTYNERLRNINYNYWLAFAFFMPDSLYQKYIDSTGLDKTDTLLFFWEGLSSIELYQSREKTLTKDTKMSIGGLFSGTKSAGYPESRDFVPISIQSGKTHYIYVKINHIEKMGFIKTPPSLFTKRGEWRTNVLFLNRTLTLYGFNLVVKGVLFFIFLLALAQFFFSKDRTYLYYAGYTLIYALYDQIFFELRFTTTPTFFFYFSEITYYLLHPLLLSSYILYFLFLKKFLGLPEKHPNLNHIFNLFIKIIIGLILIGVLFGLIYQNSLIYSIYRISAMVMLIPIGLYSVYAIYKLHDRLSKIIVVGTILFLLGSVTGFMIGYIPGLVGILDKYSLPVSHHNYTQIGVVAEVLLFFSGLGFRTKLLQDKNLEQLKVQQRLELEKKEATLAKAQVEANYAKLQVQALRKSLDDHFHKNALAAISSYILEEDNQKAAEYLNSYVELLQFTLNDSQKEWTSLNDELIHLELYVKMTKLLVGEHIQYIVELEEEIDMDIQVPTMIIQPFIENAIIHGLVPKSNGGIVWLKIREEEDDLLLVQIEDNGIGQVQSKTNRSKVQKYATGLGINFINQRLKHIGDSFQLDMTPRIEDLFDHTGNPNGTRVTLMFPID